MDTLVCAAQRLINASNRPPAMLPNDDPVRIVHDLLRGRNGEEMGYDGVVALREAEQSIRMMKANAIAANKLLDEALRSLEGSKGQDNIGNASTLVERARSIVRGIK